MTRMPSAISRDVGGGNIKVFDTTLAKLKSLFEDRLRMPVCLTSPYKLCDFRALYGYLLADWLEGYEFWGHCDNDLIFGDFSTFITDGMLARYDKILSRGHLTLYRNTPEVNGFFRKSEEFDGVPSWKEVVSTPRGFSFDEWPGVSGLWQALAPERMYDEIVFDDIIYLKKHFLSYQKVVNHTDDGKGHFIFEYDHGHLYRHGIDKATGHPIKEETLYVHFQKRPMAVETTNTEHWLCKPNSFVDFRQVDCKLLTRWGETYWLYGQYFKIRWKNLKRKIGM